jgi:hypothetical protein
MVFEGSKTLTYRLKTLYLLNNEPAKYFDQAKAILEK